MYSANELIELIGKSETDSSVRKLLSELGQSKPLKKPKRGETDTYVECQEKGITLLFRFAEAISNEVASKFHEGELVLKTIFFTPVKGSNSAIYKNLPSNLQFSTTRKEARKLLGKPEWSGNGINNDRWALENIKLHASFSDDESSIDDITVSLAN